MKRSIFALVLLPLLLALCFIPASIVSKHCTKTKELVEQAIVASDRQDFPQMLQYSEEAKKYWKSHDNILTAILRHDDSGDVGIGLAKMVSFARMQDEEEFRAACVEVIEHLSHIQEQELPLLENIF